MDAPRPGSPSPLRACLWALPAFAAIAWLAAIVLHPYPIAFPAHLTLAGLVIWAAVFARRPGLTLTRIWTSIALVGALVTSLVMVGASLEARWDEVERQAARLRVDGLDRADRVTAPLHARVAAGDRLALARLVERIREGEDLVGDLELLRTLSPEWFRSVFVLDGSPAVIVARQSPPTMRRAGPWFLRDAFAELHRAERWAAEVRPEFDRWHRQVVAHVERFMEHDGKRPWLIPHDERLVPGQVEPGEWLAEVPWRLLGRLDADARASLREDWAAELARRGDDPIELATLQIERGHPELARAPLAEAREDAKRRGDDEDLARAAVWFAFVTREPAFRKHSLEEARRASPEEAWPGVIADGLLTLERADDEVSDIRTGGVIAFGRTLEGQVRLADAAGRCDRATWLRDRSLERGRPEEVVIVELGLHLAQRLGRDPSLRRSLRKRLREDRPGLAEVVERHLDARAAGDPFAPLAAGTTGGLVWGSNVPW